MIPLTTREAEVLALLRKGWSNKRIAENLAPPCAVRTVEGHIERIADRLPNPEKIAARTLVLLYAQKIAA